MSGLNLALLQELREFMEEDVLILVDEFELDTQGRLDCLEKAIENKDAETLRTMAHTMKGGAAALGAENLSQHFRGLELRGRDASFEEIEQDFSNTKRCFAEAVRQIRAWLAQPL